MDCIGGRFIMHRPRVLMRLYVHVALLPQGMPCRDAAFFSIRSWFAPIAISGGESRLRE